MIEDEACPSAQAFTSCPKPVTTSPSMVRSTVTVEPQRRECALAVASGCGSRSSNGMFAASSRMRLL
jgi:hypothetical protein